ncbi:MAG: PKD domain-containing protein [Bacteroidetes bacterium]|nr:PKD domain-containing protein [Bacteroidota bacterium]
MNNLKNIFKSKFLVLLSLLFGINQANAQLLCTDSCSAPGPELVINGDFALQIQNSAYTTSAPFQIPIWAPATSLNFGQYTITDTPAVHNGQWGGIDHSPAGNTFFLVCDGITGVQTSAWGQDVNISAYAPNTDFVFSAWVNNSIRTTFNWVDAEMQLRVNGTLLLPASVVLPETPDVWVLIEGTWNSGPTPPASITIEVVSTSTASIGNDFAIDDISFRACISGGTGTLSVGPDVTICATDSIQLNAISNSSIIQWTPSYGLSSTTIFNPIASPDTTTTYIIISGAGTPCEATDTLTVFVNATSAVAAFQYTLDSCTNNVAFQNLSGSGFSYLWDFGDGTLATIENPSYTFTATGTYMVSLTVSDSCGSSTTIQPVNVSNALGALSQFTYTIDSCTNEVTFINQSLNSTTFNWYFGDGSASTASNPVHIYSSNGNYTISLVANNICGADSVAIPITIQPPVISTALFNFTQDSCSATFNFINQSTNSVSYSWNFGDGTTSTDNDPTHTYSSSGTYNVLLTSIGVCNTDTQFVSINVTLPIQAVSAFAITSNTCGDSISIVNSSTGFTSLLWDFGDGTTSTQTNPVHIFSAPGNYQIQLYVANSCNDSLQAINITVPDNSISGIASLISDSCFTVQFQSQLINVTNYNWNFGNGNTSSDPSPVITYSTPGNYNVTLIASNNCADTSFSFPVTINDYSITGNISLLQDSCNLTVNFQSLVNNAIGLIWDFGDGNTSATTSGTHNYNLAGNYVVILTATNACSVSQLTQNIVVDPAFEPEIFTALTLDTCLLQLTFNHSSTNTYDQIWDFGDGSSSLDQSGLHQYSITGTYELTFSVNNLSGCKRDTILNLQIPEGGGDFFIPNIFTPNNDGVNDVFEVGAAGACAPERITIFNRWGNNIFETSGQNNFWDGKSNGNPVPSGVYFYVIQIGEKVYKGTVTVTY